ncbi:diacylglycerol kinase family protein [Parabacteroides sp. Marseille-P3160]|jgi:diacylglycerol kinase (ATP)|uniref:diacylglycerol kinase family protein n=1 Tax=Parabacteroides sp. Marseille-P3160 TaxID=1917887 RepID=UPI0009BA596E|nr:diacylglycerol kinase family protein [Parabacteroides sp. Marseille-P3160]
MQKEPFSIKKRLASFRYAFNGISLLIRNEHNAWIHCAIAAGVLLAGVWLEISVVEWIIVVILIGAVLAAEAINTAIEALADKISPGEDPLIKKAKDLAAAAVLLMAIASVVIGLIIFIPKIIALL